jgi:hypothetical protein
MVNSSTTVSAGTTGAFGFNGLGTNSMQIAVSLGTLYLNYGGSTSTIAVPDYTDFTNLFDIYRIAGCEVRMFYNVNTSTTFATAGLPLLACVIDYNDINPLANLGAALEYTNCALLQLGNVRGSSPSCNVSWKPRIAAEANAPGSAVAALAPSGPIWLDSTYPNIPHYGMKAVYDNWTAGAGTVVGEIQIYVKILIECSHPK